MCSTSNTVPMPPSPQELDHAVLADHVAADRPDRLDHSRPPPTAT